jgi:polyisoprenoid-binding protein YceI
VKLSPISRFLLAAALSLPAALATSLARADDYKADPAHSSINFEVRHIFSKVKGKFKDYSGTFSFDEKKPEASKVDFSIKVASVDTDSAKRDEHLRSPDFFDAAKNPEIVFKGKSVKADGPKKYKLAGDLTLHGQTKPFTFDVEFLGGDKDPYGRDLASFTATGTIHRKEFGMVWNKTTDKGGLLIGDDVKVEVNIEGEKVKPEAKKAASK